VSQAVQLWIPNNSPMLSLPYKPN